VIKLRPVTEADADLLYEWVNRPDSLAGKLATKSKVSKTEHLKWLATRLNDTGTSMWISEVGSEPVGQVRLQRPDEGNQNLFDVDIYVRAEKRGLGYAGEMLREAADRVLRKAPDAKLRAKVRNKNHASMKLFESLNYRKTEEAETYVVLMCAARSANDRFVPNTSFSRSLAHYQRALKTIPQATQTYSKSAVNFVPGASPLFLDRGDGCRVWDVDGQVYLDYVLGLLPVVLGYRDPEVDEAIIDQLGRGISFSLATELEADVAEALVRLIPSAEMVRFAKNGSDVTAAAVRLARAHTGRDLVAVCGYHGWHDWYIGTTTRDLGVPQAVKRLTRAFDFNDADTLATLLKSEPGKFAAIMIEPAGIVDPEAGFLERVRQLADHHGAVLVFDEIVTGFRCAIGGAQARYGVTPDLSCFGKAMGNGMPISAVVGRRELMQLMDKVFVSGTFSGEALSLAAARATLAKLERCNVTDRIAAAGRHLSRDFSAIIDKRGLSQTMSVEGPDWWPRIRFKSTTELSSKLATSLMRQEMAAAGVLIGSSFNLCLAHDSEPILEDTLRRLDIAVEALATALGDQDPGSYLRGQGLQANFQVRR